MEISEKGIKLLKQYPRVLAFLVAIWCGSTLAATFFSPWYLVVAFFSMGIIVYLAYGFGAGAIILWNSDVGKDICQQYGVRIPR